MTSSQEHTTTIYRYPGVQPFKPSESEIFFGRKKETDAFYNFILSRQMVVLYGKSGYGKSSLINAGIIPRLQTNPANLYFTIRFNNYLPADLIAVKPGEALNQRLGKDLPIGQQDNPILNEITGNEKTLWYWLKQIQKYKVPDNIILFFDQFEELFTYPPDQISAFSEQLADAIYPVIPVKYRNILAEKEENNLINEDELDWIFRKPAIKVVFSIRSDRMSLLNQLADRHSSILINNYELLPLSEDDAKDAITKPAQITDVYYTAPAFSYEPGLIATILDSLRQKSGEYIETNILQIICRYIEESLVIATKKTYILSKDVGDIGNVLYEYYENVLNRLNESERYKAEELIEEHLITADQRNALSEAYIKKEFSIDDDLLKILESSSLLRKERDASGRLLYEVSHDTLVEPIKKRAALRLEKEKEKKRSALEQQIQEEKERADQLEKLRNRASTRSWIATVAAIVGITAAIIAYSSYRKADSETRKANLHKLESDSSRQRTLETLKTLNFQKAKELYTKGNQFVEYQEVGLALNEYKRALDLLDSSAINGQIIIVDDSIKILEGKILQQQTLLQKNKSGTP